MKMFFVLMTIIATGYSRDDAPMSFVPGDVMRSSLLGAADTLEKCDKAAVLTREGLMKHTGGASVVVTSCVELDREVGEAQGFEEVN